ncbi:MAG: NAD(P)/FAD-dependent oxidoreductase [Solirubrobacteraceae bacterium]|nr:NAD(P)/FAD-dependent oxidoreductase [Solirubrobacteraceae bacterium]
MRETSVLIIGAGFGGIGAAIELRRQGFRDVQILEAAPELGGTWFFNTYPGAACDIPSHFYSYSYEQRKNWSRLCSTQPEILSYMHEVSAKYGLNELITTNCPVETCSWDEEAQQWTATATDGRTFTADVLILATGQLNRPAYPKIPGIETFQGDAFHSARWNHDLPLAGKRVAVIGSGASAVQFVPEVAKQAAHLAVFQRTGSWFMHRWNNPYSRPVRALPKLPGVQAFRRSFVFHFVEQITRSIKHPATAGRILKLRSIAFMRWQLRGAPELREQLWPDYTFGCKRILFTSHFLPALRRENVELVTDAITEIDATGVKTADGRHHDVDCLIYATGFQTTDMPAMEITGRDGTSLREVWRDGAHAHLGMTVPDFPSMFVMYGPNTNTSGGSIIFFIELQAAYIRQALQLMRSRGAGAIEVRREVEAASDRALQAQFNGSAWLRCDSWYRNESGRIVTNWPGYMADYRTATETLQPSDFELLPDRTAAETDLAAR